MCDSFSFLYFGLLYVYCYWGILRYLRLNFRLSKVSKVVLTMMCCSRNFYINLHSTLFLVHAQVHI